MPEARPGTDAPLWLDTTGLCGAGTRGVGAGWDGPDELSEIVYQRGQRGLDRRTPCAKSAWRRANGATGGAYGACVYVA